MTSLEYRQGTETAAEIFDRLFLPAMAGPWAVRVADAARLKPGDRVLDVACGTGAIAWEATRRIEPGGSVVGLDQSQEMLAVARRKMPNLDWRAGSAEALPFEDNAFDAVLCQFGVMFFEDRVQALREMRRVVRPGGRIVVAVWDGLERTPGYATLTNLVERHLGPEFGKPVRDSFALGDIDLVRSLFESAGISAIDVAARAGVARFPSLQAWIDAEVKGWVGGDFGEEAYAEFLTEAKKVLSPYERPDGTVEFDLPAVVATGSKEGKPGS